MSPLQLHPQQADYDESDDDDNNSTIPTNADDKQKTTTTKQQESNNRRISFGSVSVREYERIVGDHPDVKVGPPIAIGWQYEELPPILLDDYEASHLPKQNLRLSSITRRNLLVNVWEIPEQEVADSTRDRPVGVAVVMGSSVEGGGRRRRRYEVGAGFESAEATQPQRIGDDEQRGEAHGRGRDHRTEHAEHRERDGGDVVGESPEQVALDGGEGPPRQGDSIGRRPEVTRDQREVGRLDGHIGAGAQRDSQIGPRQRGAVVDAVADHRHHPTLGLESGDLGLLLVGQHARDDRGIPTEAATDSAVVW